MAIRNRTHLKNKIIDLIRKLTWQWQPIKDAEIPAKVDKALFECASCKNYVYKGTSDKNFKEYKEKYSSKAVIKGRIYHDHIEPVIPVDKQTKDLTFDEIIDRMFCKVDNIQILCKPCHDRKTDLEKEERKRNKKK